VQQKRTRLFDHLVGDGEQGRRHLDAERPRRLQVDDELKFGRLYDRKAGRLGALENAAGVGPDLTEAVGNIGGPSRRT
jgi:hypothetical protein